MRSPFALTPVLLALFACAGDEHETPDATSLGIDCAVGAVPTFAQVTAFSRVCTNCHSSTLTGTARNGAPKGYNFDLYDRAADEAGQFAEYVSEREMPPPESGFTISDEERSMVLRWSVCGTPR